MFACVAALFSWLSIRDGGRTRCTFTDDDMCEFITYTRKYKTYVNGEAQQHGEAVLNIDKLGT